MRKLAEDVLDRQAIHGPEVDVEQVAKRLGVEVRREPTDEDLSGFLLREPHEGHAIIGVNASHPRTRRRFTIAHELGHFLMHEGERVHVDRTGEMFRVKLRDEVASQGTDPEEREANLFAAELLMPAKFLAEDVRVGIDSADDAAMRALAKRYGVSVQALTFRLANLGYIVLE